MFQRNRWGTVVFMLFGSRGYQQFNRICGECMTHTFFKAVYVGQCSAHSIYPFYPTLAG
jgi:hypothetical protein